MSARFGPKSARRDVRAALATIAVGCLVVACGSKPTTTSNDLPPPPPRRLPPVASASASAAAPRMELTEGDFTPSDQNRDPFRGYAEIFVASNTKKTAAQQKIIADRYALDELKLVAVITGNTASRAMFVDPSGKGHVVTRGELVGRSESVRATAQIQSYEASWKVDRIREGDVVFVREDPERPNVAAATRVIALRPEGDPPPARRLGPGAKALSPQALGAFHIAARSHGHATSAWPCFVARALRRQNPPPRAEL